MPRGVDSRVLIHLAAFAMVAESAGSVGEEETCMLLATQ